MVQEGCKEYSSDKVDGNKEVVNAVAMVQDDTEERRWARTLFNDFDPFQRLPNQPFKISGRPRAMSVDTAQSAIASGASASPAPLPKPNPRRGRRLSSMAIPKLETIFEVEEEFGSDIESLFD